jgi:predicted kinase
LDEFSKSKVILMCGPAGAGKSTFAKKLQKLGMTILSYDKESFKRGLTVHPLPEEIAKEIKTYLDGELISLIERKVDIVLDYSFWSREMRKEYISLLKNYNIEPAIYYIKTPKEVIMERIRKRSGNHHNDIMLSDQTASLYYDNFQPPTADEGEIIVVEE